MDRLQELVRLHRIGTGAREVARLLKMGPNTERDYREALEAAGLLDGAVDDLPELAVLKEAVQQHLAKAAPAQMTSSISDWEPKVIKLAEQVSAPAPGSPGRHAAPAGRVRRQTRGRWLPESRVLSGSACPMLIDGCAS